LNPNATINFRVKNHQGKRKSQKNEGDEHEDDSNLNKQDDAMPEDGWEVFHFSGGLAEYVKHINRDRISSHEPIVFSRKDGDIHVDVALQWCSDAFSDTLIGFVNSIKTIDGGTHMDGFKSALTRTGTIIVSCITDNCVMVV
jgi:DNA gyrase/topoisomerase IV subunit B